MAANNSWRFNCAERKVKRGGGEVGDRQVVGGGEAGDQQGGGGGGGGRGGRSLRPHSRSGSHGHVSPINPHYLSART